MELDQGYFYRIVQCARNKNIDHRSMKHNANLVEMSLE